MSLDATGESRVRIIGKRATHAEVAQYVASQLNNPNVKKSHLATQMGISRPTLDKYAQLAATLNIKSEQSQEKKKTALETNQPKFSENPVIATWREAMDRKAMGGKKLKESSKRGRLLSLHNICKTLHCPPDLFLAGQNPNEVLEQGRKLMTAFMEEFAAGRAQVKYMQPVERLDLSHTAYRYAQAVRDFYRAHGFVYPTGEGGVMSQSVRAFHGKYSDVRINTATHQAIMHELKDEHGAHSDEWMMYSFGIEIFARHKALFEASAKYEEFESNGKNILVCKVFESKTQQYKGGIWSKHVFGRDIQAEFKRRANIQDTVFPHFTPTEDTALMNVLRQKYKEHGLLDLAQQHRGEAESSYFFKMPTHALRHAGAQRLLRATGWNVAYVARRGWKTTEELIQSYGEMPADLELHQAGNVKF